MNVRRILTPLSALVVLGLAGLACVLTAPLASTPTAASLLPTSTASPNPVILPTEAIPATPRPAGGISPGGPWLIYPSVDGTTLHIYDEANGNPTQVPTGKLLDPGELPLGVSPAGGWLAFRSADLRLELLHLPDGHLETITPLVSPELQKNAQSSGESQPEALTVILQAGGLAWSPDGRWLAFLAAVDGPSSDLYIYDTQTKVIRRLTSGMNQAATPFWAPDGMWVLVQEMERRPGGSSWRVNAVWAAAMDHNEVRKIYTPPAESNGEVFLGWSGAENLACYSLVDGQGSDLRLAPLSARWLQHEVGGPFSRAALNPRTGALALIQADGLHLYQPGSASSQQVRVGAWNRLTWSPVDGRFQAGGAAGVLLFDSMQNTLLLANDGEAAASPDGQWLLGWNDASDGGQPGLRLYSPAGQELQRISADPVQAALWQLDAKGFFFLSRGQLYHAGFPTVNPALVDGDAGAGMVWVQAGK